jgi:hypothetical protein
MDRLKQREEWLRTTLVTATALLALVIEHFFHEHLESYKNVAWLVALFFAAVAAKASELLVEGYSASRTRRKRILGHHWVEGLWVDQVREKSTGKLISLGLIYIDYADGQLTVNGEGFSPDGESTGAFQSDVTRIVDTRLQFIYHSGIQSATGTGDGYAEYNFIKPIHEPPRSYHGFFFDTNSSQRFDSRAQKKSDGEIPAEMQCETLHDYIRKMATQYARACDKIELPPPDEITAGATVVTADSPNASPTAGLSGSHAAPTLPVALAKSTNP